MISWFYYSFTYDLKNLFEKHHQTYGNKDIFHSANKQFSWNINLINNFIPFKDSVSVSEWLAPVVCGYVGSFSINF